MRDISRKHRLLLNAGILTISAFLSRFITMAFQAWIASRIGASGIGLFQLTGSVTAFFSVISISGIRFTASRLVAEENAKQHSISSVMRRCAVYAAVFGLCSGAALYLNAQALGFLWIGDARTVLSLKIAAAAMPFVAFSAVFSGYLAASERAWKLALIAAAEQLCTIACTVLALRHCNPNDLEQVCASITGSSTLSAAFSLFITIPLYHTDHKQFTGNGRSPHLTQKMLGIAIPLAVSSYVRTGLGTIEHLVIPRALELSGLSAQEALSGYGIVHGMSLPAVLFPACALVAIAELSVPVLTEAQTLGNTKGIQQIIKKIRSFTLVYAAISACIITAFSQTIAGKIYHTPEASGFIRLLAPLVPIMNLDTVTDGCLRGLGQQRRVMQINILDAALGVMLVQILIPKFGVRGYVMMVWITELINCIISTAALQMAKKESRQSVGIHKRHYALL